MRCVVSFWSSRNSRHSALRCHWSTPTRQNGRWLAWFVRHSLQRIPKPWKSFLDPDSGNGVGVLKRKSNIFGFLWENRRFLGFSRRGIGCAHSRTVKALPWPCFREEIGVLKWKSNIFEFSLQYTNFFPEQGQGSVLKPTPPVTGTTMSTCLKSFQNSPNQTFLQCIWLVIYENNFDRSGNQVVCEIQPYKLWPKLMFL
jgi:hypothetical protein